MRTPGPPDDPDLARAGQAAKPEASTEPIGETRSRRACETNELAGGAASCLWRNQATVVSGGLSTDPIGGIEVNDLFGARSRMTLAGLKRSSSGAIFSVRVTLLKTPFTCEEKRRAMRGSRCTPWAHISAQEGACTSRAWREWSASWQCESEIGRCLWRVGHRRGEGERLPGKSFFGLCLCAFRFAHRHFASRRVSAAGWGKPGIHQFKPRTSRSFRTSRSSSRSSAGEPSSSSACLMSALPLARSMPIRSY